MKETKYLLSNKFKRYGWVLFICGCCIGLARFIPEVSSLTLPFPIIDFSSKVISMKMSNIDITGISAMLLIIVGSLLASMSKEKVEDEFVNKMRLESLVWALYVNFIIVILCILLLDGFTLILGVATFNLFALPTIFTLRFKYSLYKAVKGIRNEE